jgi:hypothetical protein
MKKAAPSRQVTFCGLTARTSRLLEGAIAILIAVTSSGCMQRRMTIVSNPPGATAYVDGVEIGKTPVSHDFTYYGTREIKLVREGYKTLTLLQPMSTPWYQVPPLDFFSDNLAFGEIRDERVYRYDLEAAVQEPFDNIIARGEELRRGSVTPAAATVTTPVITYPPPIGSAGSQPGVVVGPPAGGFPGPTLGAPAFGAPTQPNANTLIPPGQAPGRPRRSWPTPN